MEGLGVGKVQEKVSTVPESKEGNMSKVYSSQLASVPMAKCGMVTSNTAVTDKKGIQESIRT